MKSESKIKMDLLLSLTEPQYARVDFLKAKQSQSIYSKKVYAKKLFELINNYLFKIRYREKQVNRIGNEVYDYKLSLFNETEGVLYGHFGMTELDSLTFTLNELINEWYPETKVDNSEFTPLKPINWNKGRQSLQEFLDIIKSEGLIEKRDTEEIIQEHFFVDGQAPIKEPHSIKWLIESKYLAYLMHSLAEEFIINIKGKKHELTASHFISSKGELLKPKSLASQLSQIQKEKSNNTIHTISSIISKLKS